MKKNITSIITYLLFTLASFTGCSNDSDEEKVTYKYSLSVDCIIEGIGNSDPAIIVISKKTEDARLEINKTFENYSQRVVTGKGITKKDAEKDADSQAQVIFNQYKDQTEDKLNQLDNDFVQWCKEYSDQLNNSAENEYRKYKLVYLLKREEEISDHLGYGKIVDFGNQHSLEVYTKRSYK